MSGILGRKTGLGGGGLGSMGASPQKTFIPVKLIQVDPNQPRKLLPKKLRAKLEETRDPIQVMDEWMVLAEESTAAWKKLDGIINLAESILAEGLINPITVVEESSNGFQYKVVSGERRYWSHVYLAQQSLVAHGGQSDAVQVHVSAPVDTLAHQLIENLQRQDMNGVETALGLASYKEVSGKQWKDIEMILGVSRQQRSRISRLLKLSAAAQGLAMDHGLKERALRPVISRLEDKPAFQVETINFIIDHIDSDADDKLPLEKATKQKIDSLLNISLPVNDPIDQGNGYDSDADDDDAMPSAEQGAEQKDQVPPTEKPKKERLTLYERTENIVKKLDGIAGDITQMVADGEYEMFLSQLAEHDELHTLSAVLVEAFEKAKEQDGA